MLERSKKTYPICNKATQKYETKASGEGISKRIKDCPSFESASVNHNPEYQEQAFDLH